MKKEIYNSLSYNKTNYFSTTVIDYLSQKESLQDYYVNFPNKENFKKQIKSKKATNFLHRKILVDTLNNQYKSIETSIDVTNNIQLLKNKNTFTVTTGHQLNLFTGPLYFLYKIISTINLCKELKDDNPTYNFVPIYWMATEDHDFEEIKYFNFKDKKITWNKNSKGAVGRFTNEGLETTLNEIKILFGDSKNATQLIQLFEQSYLENKTLSDATRFLANSLFQEYGLVILDADDTNLKKVFIPIIKEEVLNQFSYKEVSETNTKLQKKYKIQVNPREINLFYLTNDFRERIIFKDGIYRINNTPIQFTKKEILREIENSPEKFSPNVILRPLYQEIILPNLCYIGGGGELAYWLELEATFKKVNVIFPILLLRNSVLIVSDKQQRKLNKLNITREELFLQQHELIDKKIKEISNLTIDFSSQKEFLENQFTELKIIASKTDKSFIGAVNAQEKKQLNGLTNLEKRLLKAEKRRLSKIVNRIKTSQNELFPKQSLQERHVNFSEMYLEYGEELIPTLINSLKPLDLEFSILTL